MFRSFVINFAIPIASFLYNHTYAIAQLYNTHLLKIPRRGLKDNWTMCRELMYKIVTSSQQRFTVKSGDADQYIFIIH
jgi:hypothetical protein